MTKQDFLSELKKALSGLPEKDINESLEYYSEMIDDRIEDGTSEEEAVAALGSVDEIAKRILMETPLPKLIKSKVKPKRKLRGIEITLLILGFPLWFPLLIVAFSVVLSLYAVLWSVIAVIYAVGITFAASSVAVFAGTVSVFIGGNSALGLLMLGSGLFLAGAFIFSIFGCKAATKGILLLSKKILHTVKMCFIKKEA